MIRDPGPVYNLGFGATTRNSIAWNPDEQEGISPDSGPIAKVLHDHPVMRFFAAGAATLVGAVVAGQLVRKGGVRLGLKLSEHTDVPWVKNMVTGYRDVQATLDTWQGINRTVVDKDNPTRLFIRGEDGKIVGDTTRQLKGFFFTQGETSTMERYGHIGAGQTPTEWSLRNEVQQRLVRSARRLPYELPAAYMMQRGIADRMLGEDNKPENFHWYNPVDVISDFVTQSVKNTAFAIMPFEAAGGSVAHGYKKLMMLGDDLTNLSPVQETMQGVTVSLKSILAQVGADASDLYQKTAQFSSKVTGSFATGLQETQNHSASLMDFLHKSRSQLGGMWASDSYKSLSPTQKILTNMMFLPRQMELGNIPSIFDIGPGPFSGMGSGFTAARQEWGQIGIGQEAYQEMRRHGISSFMRKYGEGGTRPDPARVDLLKGAITRTGSPIQELADSLRTMVGGGPKGSGVAWTRSDFYRGQMQQEYTQMLSSELKRREVVPGLVDDFFTVGRVQAPGTTTAEGTEAIKRIGFGRRPFYAGEEDAFYASLRRRMHWMAPRSERDKFIQEFPSAIKSVDDVFKDDATNNLLYRKIGAEWTHFEEKELPGLVSGMVKPLPLRYEDYAGAIWEADEKLLRRAATALGIKQGTRLDMTEMYEELAKRGLDYKNPGQIRAFLMQEGHMTKPWQEGGRNLFGFRPLTINAGMERGLFHADPETEATVNAVMRNVQDLNPALGERGYKLGGLYEAANGQIVDLGRIRRGLRSFGDKFSTDFQIPLIHLNPLSIFNYKGIREVQTRSILQYVPGRSWQPFLGEEKGQTANDFYIWARSGTRGSKGKVVGVGLDEEATVQSTLFPGLYRPFGTTGESIIPHHTQLAAGSMGQAPIDARETRRQTWLDKIMKPATAERIRKTFNPAEDQSRSLFSYIRRFRNRSVDLKNPRVMSQLMGGEEITAGGSRYSLHHGRVWKNGAVFKGPEEVAEAFDDLQYALRPYGFPDRSMRTVLGADDRFAAAVRYQFDEGVEPTTFSLDDERSVMLGDVLDDAGKLKKSPVRTPSQVVEAMKKISDQDSQMEGLTDEILTILRRARSALIDRHLKVMGQEGYLEMGSGVAGKSGTIYSRTDEMKSDLQKYLILRQQTLGERTSYASLINDMMASASGLRGAGQMTQAEFTEFRTALLSLQVNFQSFKAYNPETLPLQDAQAVVEKLLGMSAGATGEAFRSFGRGEVGISKNRLGTVQPWFRRNLGIAPAQYEGTEYNVFGDTKTVFVPTTGTAFRRNPMQTALSATGIKTWDNQEGYSPASIPMSHFIERLNKPFQLLGMGMEQTAFHGPLDFYARGMVAQRMLPLVAGSAGVVGLDRTLGGYVNPKDQYGERQYKPVFLGGAAKGVVAGEAAVAGLVPGGMSYGEKMEQLEHGEVPIREGRFWPLGSTPFMGGRIKYYRPSWYQRFMSGYQYTDQTYGSPLERMAYDYDFSPLRPLDPYHFEREHYQDRPYPVTGDYFTGPWGPLTSVLNATVGRVLKPRAMMHEDMVSQGLGQYQPVGETGSYFGPALGGPMVSGGGGGEGMGIATGGGGGGGGGSFVSVPISGGGSMAGGMAAGSLAASNQRYAQAGAISVGSAATRTRQDISGYNEFYSNAANIAARGQEAYGIPRGTGMPPRIIPSGEPVSEGAPAAQLSELGYKTQELLGIYGFLSSSIRTSLGLGNTNLTLQQPMLASASQAYGASRAFWDLNLGGTGDIPSPLEGNYANLEISEILRRFIPKPRSEIQQINPIPNALGITQPWLPGADYFTDFTRGDPYSKIPEGEMRLPGAGYERLHKLHGDAWGQYGPADRFKILGDVAPWSNEYHALDRQIDELVGVGEERDLVETTRYQVAQKNIKHTFTPYKYKYETPAAMLDDPVRAVMGRWWEGIEHKNTFLNTKFLPVHTAVEDWEREHVYGSTFPEWSHPIQDFIKPLVYTNTQRNPLAGALVLGATGTFFGATGRGKAVGGIVGAGAGLASGTFGSIYKGLKGHRYIPEPRREQLALEENVDILNYVRNMHLYNQANMEGNTSAANAYRQAAQKTMYGADIYNGDLAQIAMAMPERKRDHFRAMLSAPVQERGQILSTAPRLERRIYEAAWGMPVEKRPDLADYFTEHELPDADWEGFYPNTNMDQVKVKIGQSMGIDMSEMGYYPQQIMEANRVNPSYPAFRGHSNKKNVEAELRMLMSRNNIDGSVQPIYTPYPGTKLEINSGVG